MGKHGPTIEALTMEAKRTIGANIARLRVDHGMTIAELADLVGTSSGRMGRMERGEARVCLDDLALIADALDVDMDALVAGV